MINNSGTVDRQLDKKGYVTFNVNWGEREREREGKKVRLRRKNGDFVIYYYRF